MQQMLANLRARREDERGFTLIELMVVVLIIAILIAIAIPTFLGAKSRAQDKAAQSSLRNAVTNAKAIYTDTNDYVSATPAALLAAEPSLSFNAAGTASTGPKNVSVATSLAAASPSWVVLTSLSAAGNCFAIADSTQYGTMFKVSSGACDATTIGAPLGSIPTANSTATVGGTWASSW